LRTPLWIPPDLSLDDGLLPVAAVGPADEVGFSPPLPRVSRRRGARARGTGVRKMARAEKEKEGEGEGEGEEEEEEREREREKERGDES